MVSEQDEMKEILEEFFIEAQESLDEIEQNLIRLESLADEGPSDAETVDVIFRGLHTLKGGAGFLGFEKMAKLAHAGENLLDEIRSGQVRITKDVMDALLETSDSLKELLQKSQITGADPEDMDASDLVTTLHNLVEQGSAPEEESPAEKRPSNDSPAAEEAPVVNEDLLAEVMSDDRLAGGEIDGKENGPTEDMEIKRGEKAPPPPEKRKTPDRRDGPEERRTQNRRGATKETTIRVDTSRLDKVMNLVGELVLSRNGLMQQLQKPEIRELIQRVDTNESITANMESLSRVTQDLQMSVLSTRMQPIKRVFDKIPRQVRELKNALKKEVNLIIEGESTEVDKTLVEELADPMVHLVRNALDHGIEDPEERMAADKDPEAKLYVRAFYEGNNIVIQVEEDGRGIDPEKIRAKAIEKGLVDEATARQISDHEALRFIFSPGFSTAQQISDVSGRGVGMDVVNSKIMEVKGSVDIRSTLGKGTCISIYLPLTLAIIQALVVSVRGESFAVPIADISEVIKFNSEDIHRVNDRDVIELRGEVLPLFYLSELTHDIPTDTQKTPPRDNFVVVVREAGSSVGIVVEQLLGQEEAVVKPVTDVFDYHKAISGATIRGDGTVNMILDIPFLMKSVSHAEI